jgi:WD40 repeat protein
MNKKALLQRGITGMLRFVSRTPLVLALAIGVIMIVIVGYAKSGANSTPQDLVRKIAAQAPYGNSLAWSPDSSQVAVGSSLPPIKIWNVDTGQMLGSFPDAGTNANGLAWAPDGAKLAAASPSTAETLWVWHIDRQQLVFSANPNSGASNVAWSPDGAKLAVAISGRTVDQTPVVHDSALEVYEADNWHVQYRLPYTNFVGPVAWSPDSEELAFVTANADLSSSTVMIWDLRTGELFHTDIQHSSYVTDIEWSPDGSTLATSSFDGTILLYPVHGSLQISTLVHGGRVNGVTWSPDSKKVASAGEDEILKLWDATTHKALKSLAHGNSSVKAVGWSPNGLLLASLTSSGDLWLWNAK